MDKLSRHYHDNSVGGNLKKQELILLPTGF